MKEETLFEKLGGESMVNVATAMFYQRVMADPYINRFFKGSTMADHLTRQKSFMVKIIFTGSDQHPDEHVRFVHNHLVKEMGLKESHFDQLLSHLRTTLAEIGIDDELIHELMLESESFRGDVLSWPTA